MIAVSGFAVSPLVVVFIAIWWYQSYARLSHFPGPRLAAWTKLPLIWSEASGKAHLELLRMIETYGRAGPQGSQLVRIAPNILLTGDPDFMRHIAAPRSGYQRNAWYMAFRFNPERDNLVSCLEDDVHSALRAKMTQGYSGKEVVGVEETIDHNVSALIHLIESKYVSEAGETKPLDLAQKSQYFTMDTISHLSFGKPLGFLVEDRDMYDYLKTSAEAFPFFIMLSLFPWLVRLLQWRVMKTYLPSTNDTFGMGKIMAIAQESVGERFDSKSDEEHQDMLASFIRHGLTREEAESESVLQLLAGAETTATAVRIALFYIFTNPRVLAALRTELARERPLSPIPDENARKLPYLQAVLRESLRICPPITGLVLRNVPPSGDMYNGMLIPGGTVIGYSVMAVMRDRKAWGADVDVFRPERFLDGSEDELRERDAMIENVFGYGRYRCLGRNIALIELNKAVTEVSSVEVTTWPAEEICLAEKEELIANQLQVVRNFDLTVIDPTNPFQTFNAGVHVQSGMWMRITKARNS